MECPWSVIEILQEVHGVTQGTAEEDTLRMLCEHYGNTMARLWEYCRNAWEYYWNALALLWQEYGKEAWECYWKCHGMSEQHLETYQAYRSTPGTASSGILQEWHAQCLGNLEVFKNGSSLGDVMWYENGIQKCARNILGKLHEGIALGGPV